jgi:hypothetical protein
VERRNDLEETKRFLYASRANLEAFAFLISSARFDTTKMFVGSVRASSEQMKTLPSPRNQQRNYPALRSLVFHKGTKISNAPRNNRVLVWGLVGNRAVPRRHAGDVVRVASFAFRFAQLHAEERGLPSRPVS